MTNQIDHKAKKYTIRFKPKDQRPNQVDDKIEIFRHAIGLEDTNNILDVVKESEKTARSIFKHGKFDKDKTTISDINSYDLPIVISKLTPEQFNKIRKDPNVQSVQEDKVGHTCISSETIPWGITRVKAQPLDDIDRRGRGVSVAVLDTGVDYNHTDIKPNFFGGISTVDYTNDFMDDFKPVYHGTHVAGTIAAAENNFGVIGVADECRLYGVKIGDKNGANNLTDTIEALLWATTNKIQVVNMSNGGTNFTSTNLSDAIQGLINSGSIVCAAAGNDGKNEIYYPAQYPNVIACGAIDQNNAMATFSNFGSHQVFVGPGVNVESDMPGNKTQFLSGTSQAAPHVSGVMALCFAAYRFSHCDNAIYNPSIMKSQQIINVVKSTVDTFGKASPGTRIDDKFGYGIPNAVAATKKLLGE